MVGFLTCVWEVSGLNLGWNDNYSDWCSSLSSSSSQCKCCGSTSIRPQSLPSTSFPFHYLPSYYYEVLYGPKHRNQHLTNTNKHFPHRKLNKLSVTVYAAKYNKLHIRHHIIICLYDSVLMHITENMEQILQITIPNSNIIYIMTLSRTWLTWFRTGTGVGACKCGDESLGSIKCMEFLHCLKTCYLLRKGYTPWRQLLIITLFPILT